MNPPQNPEISLEEQKFHVRLLSKLPVLVLSFMGRFLYYIFFDGVVGNLYSFFFLVFIFGICWFRGTIPKWSFVQIRFVDNIICAI